MTTETQPYTSLSSDEIFDTLISRVREDGKVVVDVPYDEGLKIRIRYYQLKRKRRTRGLDPADDIIASFNDDAKLVFRLRTRRDQQLLEAISRRRERESAA